MSVPQAQFLRWTDQTLQHYLLQQPRVRLDTLHKSGVQIPLNICLVRLWARQHTLPVHDVNHAHDLAPPIALFDLAIDQAKG